MARYAETLLLGRSNTKTRLARVALALFVTVIIALAAVLGAKATRDSDCPEASSARPARSVGQ